MDLTTLQSIVENEVFMAFLMTIVWNVFGYVASIAKLKQFEKWDKYKALETLAIFEGTMITASTVGGVDTQYSVVIAIIVAVIRSLKKTVPESKP